MPPLQEETKAQRAGDLRGATQRDVAEPGSRPQASWGGGAAAPAPQRRALRGRAPGTPLLVPGTRAAHPAPSVAKCLLALVSDPEGQHRLGTVRPAGSRVRELRPAGVCPRFL